MFRALPRALCLILAAGVAASASAAPLAYHFQDGESFTLRVHNVNSPPSQGDIETTADYAFQASGDDPYALDADITGSSNRVTIGDSQVSFDLTGAGQASNLASPQKDHPVDGAFVKNAPGLFPPLPGGETAPGTTWEVQAVLYAPEMDLPGSFTSLRTRTTYTYEGIETTDAGRQVHVLTFHTEEGPGARQKMSVDGRTWIDVELGRPVKSNASGHLKVKVAFFWVTVPVTYTLEEVTGGSPVLD